MAELELGISWSREASAFLRENRSDCALDFSRSALDKVVATSLKIALASAPIYPELRGTLALQNEAKPIFAVDFFFHDDASVQKLNKTHRNKDKPTDVLSFPLFEGEVFVFPAAPDEPIALGDMVVSVETAARQAVELGHSLADEIAFLSIHGALHLLGYDHGNDRARRQMFALQNRLFEEFREQKSPVRRAKTPPTSDEKLKSVRMVNFGTQNAKDGQSRRPC